MPTGPDADTLPALVATTPDGVDLAVYDFGGTGPDLLLVHATGFCAGVLRPLARHLAGSFRCRAVDLRGHGRSGRPADGNYDWAGFATDVLTVVDVLGLEGARAVGHSCGGASLLLAEARRPGTFASLYAFEPVVMPERDLPFPLDQNPLSVGARRRRDTFPSTEDAFVNFSSKPPFGGLDPDVLRRYVEDGFETVPDDEGGDGSAVRLRCRREDEALVYQFGQTNRAFARLPGVRCPVTFAYGTRTDAFGEAVMAADAARVEDGRVEAFDGLGHFGPLERPDRVAASIVRALGSPGDTPRP